MTTDYAGVSKHLLKRWRGTMRALDALTDLGLTPYEAMQRFAKIVKRWPPFAQAFLLHIGFIVREQKAKQARAESEAARWADDGGRA